MNILPIHCQPIDGLSLLEMVGRLVLAALLGGLVGYERETHGRPAGLRTHMLVCMGSTIFTIVSASFGGSTPDPSRVASQIVSGIGFLGAGTIIRQGSMVRGLTTAASLWTVAALGMAVGVNWNLAIFAVIAAILVFGTLSLMNKIEHTLILTRRFREIAVIMKEGERRIADVLAAVSDTGAEVVGMVSEPASEPGMRLVKIRVRIPSGMQPTTISQSVSAMPDVTSFEWD